MSRATLKAIQAAAGNAGEAVYVDDVFSTYLYTGTNSVRTITNGIDLADKGGLVWTKRRTDVFDHNLYDTERGADNALESNTSDAVHSGGAGVIQFNSNGFNLGTGSRANANGQNYVSWTFRKQPGFFDVVTWTGDGTVGRQIPHNLESTPGFVAIKRTDSADNWKCWHTSTGDGVTLELDGTTGDTGENWPTGGFTSTYFTVKSGGSVNAFGGTYVAYLFANDAQDFGTNSNESIIKCGSYTGTATIGSPTINLGFEPQFVLVKRTDSTGNWIIQDNMRSVNTTSTDMLFPNLSNAATTGSYASIVPTATGFYIGDNGTNYNASGGNYIYVAIRRPHKPASELEATGVFSVKNYAATTSSASVTHDVVFDAEINANRDVGTSKFHFVDQLRGINGVTLRSSNTSQELSYPTFWSRQNMYTMYAPSQFDSWWASSSGTQNHISYALKRAPGFFDIVAYTGTGSTLVLDHNLGVEPEFMIVKGRTITAGWHCYHKDVGNTKAVPLNSDGAESTSSFYWNNTSPTATQATLGAFTHYNVSNQTGILYLFATVAGISKVGSYSGTGSDVNVDCGFSSGARMVWVKRADSSGDWFVWDSVRGIVAGNDPYLRLNSETAEVTTTDYIDPLSSGFTITSSAPAALNTSGGTYIFLAIA